MTPSPRSPRSPKHNGHVTKLRADGEAHHKAGKHQEAVDSLAKAKGILGMKAAAK